MKPVEDEEVVSLESLTALTDLERLADGRKRLKGYSQEGFIAKKLLLFWQTLFPIGNRTAMLYID